MDVNKFMTIELPPPAANDQETSIDEALDRVHSRYGANLDAFFTAVNDRQSSAVESDSGKGDNGNELIFGYSKSRLSR